MASLPLSQRPSPTSSRNSASQTSSPVHTPGADQTPQDDVPQESIVLEPTPELRRKLQRPESSRSIKQARAGPTRRDTEDVRKCWVCFSDETEDTPMSSRWRSPCPCSLTAHEACLLDWVANIESSNSGRKKKIQCPQCKADITIVRPRSLVVDAMTSMEYAASRMVLPTVLSIGSGTVVYLSMSYGIAAVYTVLGRDDFTRIFDQPIETPAQLFRRGIGVAMVPWLLIFSRTSMVDSILPIIPMIYFVTQPRPDPILEFGTWPPSAGLSFALLPYVRAAYNAYYETAWGDLERKWLNEVKPRSSSSTGNDDAGLELEIGLDDVDLEGDEADQEQQVNDLLNAPPFNAPPLDQAPIRDEPVVNGEGPRRRDYSISISKITKSIIGALVFPSISAFCGQGLMLVLPKHWTTMGSQRRPTRFLQTRWGRCLVGGCLFVVLKDAVTLYVRWKMAQTHRKRTIANYKGKTPKA